MIQEQLFDAYNNDITQAVVDMSTVKTMTLREIIDLFNIYSGTENRNGNDNFFLAVIKQELTDRIGINQ
jgi:hypothetical protein